MFKTYKSKILTNEENEVMWHLSEAQKIFSQCCTDEPQDPADMYNFGHYLDAARNAVIMRGARRLDPEHLIPVKEPLVSHAAKILGVSSGGTYKEDK